MSEAHKIHCFAPCPVYRTFDSLDILEQIHGIFEAFSSLFLCVFIDFYPFLPCFTLFLGFLSPAPSSKLWAF